MNRQRSEQLRPQPLPGMASFKKPSLKRQGYEAERSRERDPQTRVKEPSRHLYNREGYDVRGVKDKQFKEHYDTNVQDKKYKDNPMSNAHRENLNQPRASEFKRMETTAFAGDSRESGRSSEIDPRSNTGIREARRASYDQRGNASIRDDRRASYDQRGNPRGNIEESDSHARDVQRSSGYNPRGNVNNMRYSNEPIQQQNQMRQVNDESFKMRRRPHQSSQSGQVSQRVPILPNTSRPSQPPYGRQMSKKTGSEIKSAEDTFREALAKKQPLSNIPINLRQKKKLMQGNAEASFGETIALPSVSSWHKMVVFIEDIWGTIEPWSNVFKAIEGTYGSGVGSYFRLLRTLLYINTVVALLSMVFLILPVAAGNQASNNITLKFSDIFLGNGYLEDTILFYGANAYSQDSAGGYWKDFSVPKGYIYTTLAGYLIYFLVILSNVVVAYRKSFIDSAESVGKKYGSAVFTAWEMTIEDKSSAQQLKDKICSDLKKLLKQRRAVVKISKGIILLRCIIWCLVIGAIGGICFGIFQILDSDVSKNNEDVYAMPLIVSGTFLFMPWLLTFVNNLGKYGSRYSLYVRLLQTCLLVLSVLMVIRIYWFQNEETALGSVCRETRLGQEMYRLIIFYFIMIVIVNFAMETVWNLLFKSGMTFLGSPDFDISRNTTNLIYCQMVTCLGYYNSPMLPVLSTLILFLTFYIQRFSLHLNCHSSKKTWTTSTTRTLYLIITLFAILFPFVLFIYTITTDVDSLCGPFVNGVPPIEVSGINTNSETVATWIFSGAIWGGITVGFIVLLYYTWSSATEQKRLGKTLFRELKSDIKELRHLQKECVKFIKTDL